MGSNLINHGLYDWLSPKPQKPKLKKKKKKKKNNKTSLHQKQKQIHAQVQWTQILNLLDDINTKKRKSNKQKIKSIWNEHCHSFFKKKHKKKRTKFTHNFISEGGSHSNNHPRVSYKKLVDIEVVSLAVNSLVILKRAAASAGNFQSCTTAALTEKNP
jgi:hypothetical protein